MKNHQKHIMKFGKKLATLSKKNVAVNLYAMKNIQKLKENLLMEKSKQIFTIIKYQKKAVNVSSGDFERM